MPWGRPLEGVVPISHNALQHYPEFHGADTWGGYPARSSRGVPCWGVPCQWGTLLGGYPTRGYPGRVPPQPGQDGGVHCWGGYPVRTTEGVLTTRWAVCLLHLHRRTFLLNRESFNSFYVTNINKFNRQ